jgi:hypothetical protein
VWSLSDVFGKDGTFMMSARSGEQRIGPDLGVAAKFEYVVVQKRLKIVIGGGVLRVEANSE